MQSMINIWAGFDDAFLKCEIDKIKTEMNAINNC
jgi:hypothetical protein